VRGILYSRCIFPNGALWAHEGCCSLHPPSQADKAVAALDGTPACTAVFYGEGSASLTEQLGAWRAWSSLPPTAIMAWMD